MQWAMGGWKSHTPRAPPQESHQIYRSATVCRSANNRDKREVPQVAQQEQQPQQQCGWKSHTKSATKFMGGQRCGGAPRTETKVTTTLHVAQQEQQPQQQGSRKSHTPRAPCQGRHHKRATKFMGAQWCGGGQEGQQQRQK
jgi:hypothetical protein